MKRDKVVWLGCVCLFLAGGVFFTLVSGNLFEPEGLVSSLGNNQGLAAWVQAVFSVVAILAAGYFPLMHELKKERRARMNVLGNLDYLAGPLLRFLKELRDAVINVDNHYRWQAGDGAQRLRILGRAIDEIPSTLVVRVELSLLADLRYSYQSAENISNVLFSKKPEDFQLENDVEELVRLCEICIADIKLAKETIEGLLISPN